MRRHVRQTRRRENNPRIPCNNVVANGSALVMARSEKKEREGSEPIRFGINKKMFSSVRCFSSDDATVVDLFLTILAESWVTLSASLFTVWKRKRKKGGRVDFSERRSATFYFFTLQLQRTAGDGKRVERAVLQQRMQPKQDESERNNQYLPPPPPPPDLPPPPLPPPPPSLPP